MSNQISKKKLNIAFGILIWFVIVACVFTYRISKEVEALPMENKIDGSILEREKMDKSIKVILESRSEELYNKIDIKETEVQERFIEYGDTKLYKVILDDGSKTIKEENTFAIGEKLKVNGDAYTVMDAELATETEIKEFLKGVLEAEQFNELVVQEALKDYNK